MARLSNKVIVAINFLTLLLSLTVLRAGVWLAEKDSRTDCERLLKWPVISLGAFLAVLSITGILGACFRSLSWMLSVYLVLLFFLILFLFGFTVFAFAVTAHGDTGALNRVMGIRNWKRIKSCIYDSKLCNQEVAGQFYINHLSSIQSGCCKPPVFCLNATMQADAAESKGNVTAGDCKEWSSDPDRLCYDCQSCKSGVVANIKAQWCKVGVFNGSLLIALVLVYAAGCSAFRNQRKENEYAYGVYRMAKLGYP
eukprot:PITA_21477